MEKLKIMLQLHKKAAFRIVFAGIFLASLLFAVAPEKIFGTNFGASLFGSAQKTAQTADADLFVPSDYTATKGQQGEFAVISAKSQTKLTGFSIELQVNPYQFSPSDVILVGSALEGKNFFIEKNFSPEGKLNIVGATGGSGVDILSGQEIFRISGKLAESLKQGDEIKIEFLSASIVDGNLKETVAKTENGKIVIGSQGKGLSVVDISAGTDSVTVEFSAEISAFSIDDIQFVPSGVKNSGSFVKIDGKKVVISGLSLESGKQYEAFFSDKIVGNVAGNLAVEKRNMVFLTPEKSLSKFSIQKVSTKSDTSLAVEFSDAYNPNSVDVNAMEILGLYILGSEKGSSDKELILKINPQTPISSMRHPFLLTIRNTKNSDLQSVKGEKLFRNIFPVFVQTATKPDIKRMYQKDDKRFAVEFAEPIVAESVKAEHFAIKKAGFHENLIGANVTTEVQNDFKTVVFSGISIEKNVFYSTEVKMQTVKNQADFAVSPFHLLAVLDIPSISASNAAFGIEKISALSAQEIEVIFTENVLAESVKALNFSILAGKNPLQILDVSHDQTNKKRVIITTAKQTVGTTYTLLALPEKWKNEKSEILGGKNTAIFDGVAEKNLVVAKVEPSRFVENSTEQIFVFGENLPSVATVHANSTKVELVERNAAGTQYTIKIPKNLAAGNYSLTVLGSDGKTVELKNAFVIDKKEEKISVIEEKSYAKPLRIPNDNTTEATLFALVDDPRGLADIEKVTADLRILDQDAAVNMEKGEIVDGKQYFFLKVKVPTTVATKKEAYKVPITAHNKSGINNTGNISLVVSKDLTASIAPEIKKVSALPETVVVGDTKNPLKFFAEISDEDGGDDIATVAVDLSKLSAPTHFLKAKPAGVNEKTRFFESEAGVVVPTVLDGTYELPVLATDKNGEETRTTVKVIVGSNNAGKPVIDKDNFYTSPNDDLVADGKFTFRIHVKVEDPSGADDIESVVANLVSLGLEPTVLKPGVKEGKTKWFSSDPLKLDPKNATVGIHEIEITATDFSGNVDIRERNVSITKKNVNGQAPTVIPEKFYSTPATVQNDGKSAFSAYVFVEDKDEDISHVVLQLGNSAKFVGESLPEGTSAKDEAGNELCISTRTILCMKPILKEAGGQWFYITDLIVPTEVPASNEPYKLPVVAVDKEGKSSSATFQLFVGADGEKNAVAKKPYVKMVYPTGSKELQILFSAPVEKMKITKDKFQITASTDTSDILAFRSFQLSADSRVMTIQTDEMQPKKSYAMTIDTEKLGLDSAKSTDRVFPFSGFEKPSNLKDFKLVKAEADSSSSFVLTFNSALRMTALFEIDNISIFEKGGSRLKIEQIDLAAPNVLKIKTEPHKMGKSYTLSAKNLMSVYDQKMDKEQSKDADAFKLSYGEGLSALYFQADFNKDDKVDFLDFTMFSAVYGKTSADAASGDLNGDGKVDFLDFTLFSSSYGNPTASTVVKNNLVDGTMISASSSKSGTGTFDRQGDAVSSTASSSASATLRPSDETFHGAASESSTTSPSISTSATPSASTSPTTSVSPSSSPSITPSVSPTVSATTSTPTVVSTPSPSQSPIPSVSPSATPSASPSVSPSISVSPSVSPTTTPSPSNVFSL